MKAKIKHIGTIIDDAPVGWGFDCHNGAESMEIKDGQVLHAGYTVDELREIRRQALAGEYKGRVFWLDTREPEHGGVGDDGADGLTPDTALATWGALFEMASKEGTGIQQDVIFTMGGVYTKWILAEKKDCPICKTAQNLACRVYDVPLNTGIDDGGATRRKMEQLLADNPDMPREDAFLQAVVEQTKKVLVEQAPRLQRRVNELLSEANEETFWDDLREMVEKEFPIISSQAQRLKQRIDDFVAAGEIDVETFEDDLKEMMEL